LRDHGRRSRHDLTSDQDKLCTWFNRPWLAFTGRVMERELGNGWAQGVHPDDFDRCLQVYVSHFDARAPFRMQYRLRRHDGAYRWIDDSGIPRYAEDGSFLGYIGSCVDIHALEETIAQRTAELELQGKLLEDVQRERQQSERQFRTLVEGAKDCTIYMVDPQGRITTLEQRSTEHQRIPRRRSSRAAFFDVLHGCGSRGGPARPRAARGGRAGQMRD
jgi:PAS domain S-box-containing protein